MSRVVVKLGGHALDSLAPDSVVLVDLAKDVSELSESGDQVLIVHGGGPQIGEVLERLGLTSTFYEGLRVTDDATMEVVVMALAHVNVQIVAAMGHSGVRAVGLSGADDSLLCASTRGEPWGRVGANPVANPRVIEALWVAGVTPVVSSVALDADGRLLNLNADAAAGALAGALRADSLVLLSDVDQVRRDPDDPSSGLDRLSRDDALEMMKTGQARDGMRPKLSAALDALDGGAHVVTLANGTTSHALAGALGGTLAVTEVGT